jgi:hypothetical protein
MVPQNLLYFLFEFQPTHACEKLKLIMRQAVKRYTVLLEFLIALGILPGCVWSVPTICVSCGGWEGGAQSQEKAQKTRRVPTVSCTLE